WHGEKTAIAIDSHGVKWKTRHCASMTHVLYHIRGRTKVPGTEKSGPAAPQGGSSRTKKRAGRDAGQLARPRCSRASSNFQRPAERVGQAAELDAGQRVVQARGQFARLVVADGDRFAADVQFA